MKEKKLAIVEIPVNKINTGYAIRRSLDKVRLNELAGSVKDKGILQSLSVRLSKSKKGEYDLIFGLRRLKSAIQNEQETVPCIIKENVNDRELLELMLSENLQREELNPLDEAVAYARLLNDDYYKKAGGITKLAERLHISLSNIRKKIILLDLEKELQKDIYEGKLDVNSAVNVVGLSREKQLEYAKVAIEHQLSPDGLHIYIQHKENGGKRKIYSSNISAKIKKFSPLKINTQLMGYARFLESILNNIDDIPEKEAEDIMDTINEIMKLCANIKKRSK